QTCALPIFQDVAFLRYRTRFSFRSGAECEGGSVLLVGIRVGGVGIRIGIGGVLGPIRLRVLVVGRRRGIGLITCVLDDSIGLVACILGDADAVIEDASDEADAAT